MEIKKGIHWVKLPPKALQISLDQTITIITTRYERPIAALKLSDLGAGYGAEGQPGTAKKFKQCYDKATGAQFSADEELSQKWPQPNGSFGLFT